MPLLPPAEAQQIPPPPSKWRAFWTGVLHVDHAKMEPWIAARNAVGVALPLAAGIALGMPLGGLAVASGALNVAYSDNHDPYGQRARRMLAASALCAVAVMAGGLASHHTGLAIALTAIWAFGSGMAIALGPAAESLGVISIVVLIVYSAQSLTAERALEAGGLAFAGGLLQTLLSLALWPVRAYRPERLSLANLYAILGAAAASPEGLMKAPPPSEASTRAHEVLASRLADHGIETERYRSLLSQAERMRLRLFTLGRLLRRMRRQKFGFAPAEMVEAFLESAAMLMKAVAVSLERGDPIEPQGKWLDEIRAATEALRGSEASESASFLSAVVRDARFQMDSLGGQLRAAAQLTGDISPSGMVALQERERIRHWRMRFGGNLAKIRANFSLQSAVCRHAIRLSVMVAIGEVLARIAETPRAYWLPMTVVLVLKPEFAVTFTRGLLRISGTILGLLLATAMFHFLHSGIGLEVALIAGFVFLLRWVGPANYGIFGIAVSALIVLMISFTGVAPKDVILARGINTAVGGLLALAAYAVWPTWERTQVGETLARLVESYQTYAKAVASELTRDRGTDTVKPVPAKMDELRLAARRARTNAEASVERLRSEPGSTAAEGTLLTGMLASSHRFVYALMSVEAGVPVAAEIKVRPEFRAFAADIDRTFTELASALRGGRGTARKWPDLREDHRKMLMNTTDPAEVHALVNVEADRMTNSLNTLREQVEKWTQVRRR